MEVVLKVVAKGLIMNGPKSYLRSYWDILDFIIVVFSVISLSANKESLKFFKLFRMYRFLRPLRMINKNSGMKVAVSFLYNTFSSIGNVILLTLIFYVIFGVFCVTFKKGQFFFCYEEQLEKEVEGIETKYDCLNNGGEWVNSFNNFDNLLKAFEMLFCMSLVDWINQMFTVVDAKGIDLNPERDSN